jgi:hypothetical protein
MEATKTNTETVVDNAKTSEKWLNATTEAMMDIYSKQLQFTTGLYDNFINSFLGAGKIKTERKNFSDMFLNSDLGKWSGTLLNDFSSNSSPFLTTLDGFYKQMLENNRNLLASLQNINTNQIDWKAVNSEYLKTIETQIEASKKMGNSLTEAYNKRIDLSIDTNKKLMEEVNIQLNLLIKQNQKFVNEFFKTQQSSVNVEDKKSKEPSSSPSETKKKWEVPVID